MKRRRIMFFVLCVVGLLLIYLIRVLYFPVIYPTKSSSKGLSIVLYGEYVIQFGDRLFAIYQLCTKFGWYFSESAYKRVENSPHLVSDYLIQINAGKSMGKTFENNLYEDAKKNEDVKKVDSETANMESSQIASGQKPKEISVDIDITPEMIMHWGTNFEAYEYLNLENLYSETTGIKDSCRTAYGYICHKLVDLIAIGLTSHMSEG